MRIKAADYIEHVVDGLFEDSDDDNHGERFGDRLMTSVLEKAMQGDMDAIAWLEKHKLISIELTDPQRGWY